MKNIARLGLAFIILVLCSAGFSSAVASAQNAIPMLPPANCPVNGNALTWDGATSPDFSKYEVH